MISDSYTYDLSGNPQKIYFTNGSITKYVYSATGQKLRMVHYTAKANITRTIGQQVELKASEIQSTDSTDYLLGGSLVVRNGKIDKYLFDGGYAQATASGTTDKFTFYYQNKDHLGTVRETVTSTGAMKQRVNYYPFGGQLVDTLKAMVLSPNFQQYKYNGKEFDGMYGLNTYDYGARQHYPVLARWDRIDPLCEKYYGISPYAYCANNPMRFVDPDGKDVKIKVGNEPVGTTTINLYSSSELKKGNIKGPKTTTVSVYEVTVSNDSGESNTYYYTRVGYRKNYNNQEKPATEVTFDVLKDGDTFSAVVKSRWGGKDNVLELRDPNNINNQTVKAKKGSTPQNRTAIQFHIKGATDGCLLAVGKDQIDSPTEEIRSSLPGSSKAAQNSFMSDIKRYQKSDSDNGYSANINVVFDQLYGEEEKK